MRLEAVWFAYVTVGLCIYKKIPTSFLEVNDDVSHQLLRDAASVLKRSRELLSKSVGISNEVAKSSSYMSHGVEELVSRIFQIRSEQGINVGQMYKDSHEDDLGSNFVQLDYTFTKKAGKWQRAGNYILQANADLRAPSLLIKVPNKYMSSHLTTSVNVEPFIAGPRHQAHEGFEGGLAYSVLDDDCANYVSLYANSSTKACEYRFGRYSNHVSDVIHTCNCLSSGNPALMLVQLSGGIIRLYADGNFVCGISSPISSVYNTNIGLISLENGAKFENFEIQTSTLLSDAALKTDGNFAYRTSFDLLYTDKYAPDENGWETQAVSSTNEPLSGTCFFYVPENILVSDFEIQPVTATGDWNLYNSSLVKTSGNVANTIQYSATPGSEYSIATIKGWSCNNFHISASIVMREEGTTGISLYGSAEGGNLLVLLSTTKNAVEVVKDTTGEARVVIKVVPLPLGVNKGMNIKLQVSKIADLLQVTVDGLPIADFHLSALRLSQSPSSKFGFVTFGTSVYFEDIHATGVF